MCVCVLDLFHYHKEDDNDREFNIITADIIVGCCRSTPDAAVRCPFPAAVYNTRFRAVRLKENAFFSAHCKR